VPAHAANAAQLLLTMMTHKRAGGAEATGAAGEMADDVAGAHAISDFCSPGKCCRTRKTWLYVQRLKLAEWLEMLRRLPVPA